MATCFRFITHLSDEEKAWAARISDGFGQMVCGFDMLRCDGGKKSQVIDVNGWSFVKGNDTYYGKRHPSLSPYSQVPTMSTLAHMCCCCRLSDKTAEILASLCLRVAASPERPLPAAEATVEEPTWLLKANVTVFRHADRTPKQKLKFNFPIGERWTQPFVTLLNGEREEIILRERTQLNLIATAVEEAKGLGADGEDLLVPNPNHHYVEESSSDEEDEDEAEDGPSLEDEDESVAEVARRVEAATI